MANGIRGIIIAAITIGYWDSHHHYNHYIQYHGHNGYWDTTGPFRIFINVD